MAQISIRVDDDVKKLAEETCKDIGLSLSAAINVFLKKLGRERRMPFELSADPFYSEQNMARLRHSITQMETADGTVHKLDSD